MNNCEIIKDLLPLYADGVCSKASASLVEEHISECESCRAELDSMRAEPEKNAADERQAVSSFADAVKRRSRRRAVGAALAAVAVVAVAEHAGFGA